MLELYNISFFFQDSKISCQRDKIFFFGMCVVGVYDIEQARTYAKALNATLFFSSATYNINVNKIFKFITAKLFDLPWTVERNLTVGEPIIDF